MIKSKITSITIVSPGYPTNDDPYYPFVQQLAESFARDGIRVTVIAPQSITHSIIHHVNIHPIKRIEFLQGGGKIEILQPIYVTLPYKYKRINNFLLTGSIKRTIKKTAQPDVYYAHFWQIGYCLFKAIKDKEIPLFIASGESEIEKMFCFKNKIDDFSDFVKGVISVSTKNKEDSIKFGLTSEEKVSVFPNAVNVNLFHHRNREECRKQLGLPQEDFIIAFVGWFIERKGPQRVAVAISKIGGVKSLFIGKGDQEPQCDGILYKGSLPHDKIPLYLGAADVFVLPTLHEGCCNAVVEAMACGLPVVSSNLSFNWDVLDASNSILVDPNSVDEIADAIQRLRDDIELRKQLAEGALKKAESLTIDNRADAILKFIESKL